MWIPIYKLQSRKERNKEIVLLSRFGACTILPSTWILSLALIRTHTRSQSLKTLQSQALHSSKSGCRCAGLCVWMLSMSDDGLMIVKFGGPLSLPLFGHWWDGKPLIIISDVGKYTVSVYSGCLLYHPTKKLNSRTTELWSVSWVW